PDHTRIVLDLNQLAYYDMFELREPNRLVIDLKDARSTLKKKEFII
ncbi:MAG: AMIN domain-containing protein, partial [Deltaproteobacteria bacterium]|nr:AMIN domain-containing protein [Deltaproteobacteria bacterium]